MPRIGAFLSLLLAFAFIALALSPATMPAKAENTWEDYAAIAGGAVTGAAIGTMVADGPGAVVGATIGAIAGFWLANLNDDQANAYFDAAASKDAYGRTLKNITDNYIGLAHASATNLIVNYNTNQLFFARKAEWGALDLYNEQKAAGASHIWNAENVLSRSDVANGTLSSAWAIATQYEAVLNSYAYLTDSFTGTYSGMTWKVEHNSYTATSSQSNNPYRIFKVGYDLDRDYYYTLSAGSPITMVSNSGTQQTFAVTVTARNGTVVYDEEVTLPGHGGIDISVPTSGDYTITADTGCTFVALAAPGITQAGSVVPIIITGYKSGDNVRWDLQASYPAASGELYLNFEGAKSAVGLTISNDLRSIASQIISLRGQAVALAQAYYNTLVSNGGGQNRILPDVVFPDPENLRNMSAESIYAIYLAYLTQQKDWFRDYSVMTPSDVNISAESLSLQLLGSIYRADGTQLYPSGTVFTPYVSLRDMVLTSGANITFNQPGFIIVWGHAGSLATAGKMTDITYVQMDQGDYIIIDEMTRDGVPITQETLKVTTVQYVVYGMYGQPDMPQGIGDLDWLLAHWYWFAIIAGAIFVLAWIASRNSAIGIIGLALVAVGAVFWIISDASVTTGLLSGLFQRGGL